VSLPLRHVSNFRCLHNTRDDFVFLLPCEFMTPQRQITEWRQFCASDINSFIYDGTRLISCRKGWSVCQCCFNPLNTKLNPICHLLALLGDHHIRHVSRIRVNTYEVCVFRISYVSMWFGFNM